eukprot:symbB.v1.2.027271.t1/scaffold2786.1/size70438/4
MCQTVATWLRQQEVTGRVLRSLDEAELTAMGLEPFGRRRQLLLCREEILAEAAAKEKKANSPRTRRWRTTGASAQWLRQRRQHLNKVFQASHKDNHDSALDEAGRNRYADASLEKSSWPEVMEGLSWCKEQLELEQVNVGDVDAIHVLDVGSCNNAAKLQQHDVRVTALDLCPRHPSVWQCDFLQLHVLPRTKRAVREGPKLLGLPAESFDVCLFSMVLHHWTQELQHESLQKAYELLVQSGIVLVVENRAWNDEAVLSHQLFTLETEQRNPHVGDGGDDADDGEDRLPQQKHVEWVEHLYPTIWRWRVQIPGASERPHRTEEITMEKRRCGLLQERFNFNWKRWRGKMRISHGQRRMQRKWRRPSIGQLFQLLHELCPNAPVLKSSRMLTRRLQHPLQRLCKRRTSLLQLMSKTWLQPARKQRMVPKCNQQRLHPRLGL